jgi:hypothetical protein
MNTEFISQSNNFNYLTNIITSLLNSKIGSNNTFQIQLDAINIFSSLIPPIIGLFLILLLEKVIDSIYLNKLGINKIYLIIGCFFFSINKILFNIQNGFNFFYNLSFLIILRAFFFISAIFFILLNELFKEYGLLVLQPDHVALKAKMKAVFKDDLLQNSAEQIVGKTSLKLEAEYKLQVNPRTVNLFYLRDGIRNRIDKRGNIYTVDGTIIRFTEEELLQELNDYPDRFSPNVILRGIYQETILPNILFVGGGSEVAYWMQLKGLFEHYQVPFPMLVLRNSFMIMDDNHAHKMKELGIGEVDLFKEETALANELVQRWSGQEISLKQEESDSMPFHGNRRGKFQTFDRQSADGRNADNVYSHGL